MTGLARTAAIGQETITRQEMLALATRRKHGAAIAAPYREVLPAPQNRNEKLVYPVVTLETIFSPVV